MPKVYATPTWMSSANVTVQRHGKPVVVLPTNALLGQQVAFEEIDGPVMHELRGVATREPMSLTCEGHVLDRAAQLTQPANDLIGLLPRDARIVVPLEHQQRATHVVDVGDRRSFDHLSPILPEPAHPASIPPPPLRRTTFPPH